MRHGSNETLRDLLDAKGRLSLKDALRITIDLIDRLEDDRDRNQFHRSLRPEHISTYTSTLLPERISPEMNENNSFYLSPEIRDGSMPDERSTIWSIGWLLLELLTAWKPDGEEHDSAELPDLIRLRSDIPEELALLIYRMLEFDPDLRISRLENVKTAFESVLHHHNTNEINRSLDRLTGPRPDTKGPVVYNNLVFGMTRFIGRKREMSELLNLITTSEDRLFTVIGLGGIGKSRLAYELARELSGHFRDGIFFVPLNPVRSPALIVLAISNAMGFSFAGNKDTKNQLIRYLYGKEILLILDDFDELLDGTDLVLDLLQGVPNLTIMVTSRERLNVRTERVYELDGLSIPESGDTDVLHSNAVELFLEHARRVHPGFSPDDELAGIIGICKLLEGMPLGIELAASWTRVLSCAEISNEIKKDLDFLASSEGDIPARHRGIRATFDRSWELINGTERQCLARLSVFRGGFKREAARDIACVGLDILGQLIDKSLLRRDAFERFYIHELIRQYAEKKLSEKPEDLKRILDHHSEYYGDFLKSRDDSLWYSHQRVVLEQIEAELPNIGLAWNTAMDGKRYDIIMQCIDPLYLFHQARGSFKACDELFEQSLKIIETDTEENPYRQSCLVLIKARRGFLQGSLGKYEDAFNILKECLESAEENEINDAMIPILYGLSEITRRRGIFDASWEYAKRCLSYATAQKDRRAESNALSSMATIEQNRGSFRSAAELYERGLDISRELSFQRGIVRGLNGLGNVYYAMGEYERAHRYFEQGLQKAEELGDRSLAAVLAGSLGNVAVMLGSYDNAIQLYEKRLRNAQLTGDESGIGRGLFLLGGVHHRLGSLKEARDVLERSIVILRKTGEQRLIAFSIESLADVHYEAGQYDEAESLYRESLTFYTKINLKQGMISTMGGIGTVLLARGKAEEAGVILHEALGIAYELGSLYTIMLTVNRLAKWFEEREEFFHAARLYCLVSIHESAGSDLRKEATERFQDMKKRIAGDEIQQIENCVDTTDPMIIVKDILDSMSEHP